MAFNGFLISNASDVSFKCYLHFTLAGKYFLDIEKIYSQYLFRMWKNLFQITGKCSPKYKKMVEHNRFWLLIIALFLNLFVLLQTWSYEDIEESSGYYIAILYFIRNYTIINLESKRSNLWFNSFKSRDKGLPLEQYKKILDDTSDNELINLCTECTSQYN